MRHEFVQIDSFLALYNAPIIHCRKTIYKRHFHEEFQIGFVEGGALDVLLPTIHQVASTNELFIIPPGEVHVAQSLGEIGWSYHMLYLGPNLLQHAVVETTERDKPLHLRPFMIASQQIRAPFQRLCTDRVVSTQSSKRSIMSKRE